jgi:hypothetical protein
MTLKHEGEIMSNRGTLSDLSRAVIAARRQRSGLWRCIRDLWQGFQRLSRRPPRRLRLCESLPLGERRFVAVVEFERARFLVGGTSASLVLLERLGNAELEDNGRPAIEKTALSEEELP